MCRLSALACIVCISLVVCATVSAKSLASIEQIDGFTQSSAAIHLSNSTTAETTTDIIAEPASTESQNGSTIARKHHGPVLSLAAIPGTSNFFSAGQDGFLSYFTGNAFAETWQISDIPLRAVAVHPAGNLVAVYESDGYSIYRVSVWNWKNKTRLYAKRFRDSVISLSWSAKGTWLMIGNTSVEGITVLAGSTGEPASVFKTNPGIVSLGTTGASETNMVTFGPSGRIRYTDVSSGKERAIYESEHDLLHPVLLNNNMKIAGFRDNSILVIDATSGKTTDTIPAHDPVMATRPADSSPVWFEKNNTSEWDLHTGTLVSGNFSLPDKAAITAALGLDGRIIIGSSTGSIYTIPSSVLPDSVPELTALLKDNMQPIDDIIPDGSRLFLLSSGSLFISTGPGKSPVFAFDGIHANRMALLDSQLVFWSNNSPDPVIITGFDGESRKTIYQPKDGIKSLSVYGTRIAFVEGTSLLRVLDTASLASLFSYTGAGLQDAVLVAPDRLVVSKSANIRAQNPLILINTTTGETVPVPVPGNLCFGLRLAAQDKAILNGFIVKEDNMSASTDLVTLQVDTESVSSTVSKSEAKYADEDLVATLAADGDHIFTNLGKNSLVSIKTDNGKQTRFNRGYALPAKISVMDQFIVTLNYDGSLTWFERNSGNLLSTASITEKGLWAEE